MMVRPVVPADTQALVALSVSSGLFKPEKTEAVQWMLDEYQSSNSAQGQMVVFEKQGALLGVAYYAPRPFADRVWELLMIAVNEADQRQGIGSTLLKAVENAVQGLQGRLLLIETSDQTGFERTRLFYRKHGYSQVALIPDYFTDGDGKVSFVKRLQDPTQ